MKQRFIDEQLDLISEWGIAKRFIRYRDSCQVVHVDEAIGEGYFSSYDFEKVSLLKLSGRFDTAQQISSTNDNAGNILYFLLEGNYSFHTQATLDTNINTDTAKTDTCVYQLKAPSFWLFSGISKVPLTAHVPANTNIRAFQIHLSDAFVELLIKQFQDKPFAQQGLLEQFLLKAHASENSSEIEIPLSQDVQDVYQKAWTLFNIAHPTDEMSLLSLQGATFTFLSELLTLPSSFAYANTRGIPSYALQAKLLLEQCYFENWTTRELAKKVNTNESYLKKYFKMLTGMSLNQYRTHIRMEQAEKLLASGVASQEVAHRLGFSNHYYFKKVFSRYKK